jgi:hypothetical protein
VAVVLVTGMSGTGKSAALAELARRGHRVVDTDYGAYSEEVPCSAQVVWSSRGGRIGSTRAPLDEVVDALESIADTRPRRSERS